MFPYNGSCKAHRLVPVKLKMQGATVSKPYLLIHLRSGQQSFLPVCKGLLQPTRAQSPQWTTNEGTRGKWGPAWRPWSKDHLVLVMCILLPWERGHHRSSPKECEGSGTKPLRSYPFPSLPPPWPLTPRHHGMWPNYFQSKIPSTIFPSQKHIPTLSGCPWPYQVAPSTAVSLSSQLTFRSVSSWSPLVLNVSRKPFAGKFKPNWCILHDGDTAENCFFVLGGGELRVQMQPFFFQNYSTYCFE